MFYRNRVYFLLLLSFILGIFFSPSQKEAAAESWTGNFYNGMELVGDPITEQFNNLRFVWNNNSPINGINADNFSAVFEKDINISSNKKDYYFHAFADEGIRMYLDNQLEIDGWENSAGKFHSAVLTNLSTGTHKVKSEYYEANKNAELFADMIPFDTWIGYYYNNKSFSGIPVDAKIYQPSNENNLVINNGYDAPGVNNIGNDNYTLKLYTYKKLTAGEYIIRTKSDDGIRVYIDNKKVIDRNYVGEDSVIVNVEDLSTESNKNVHEIRIEYLEKTGKSNLEFSIKTIKQELSTNYWLAAYYNNINTSGPGNVYGGNSVSSKIANIFYNWSYSVPNSKTKKDNFSASYYKRLNKGEYFVHTFLDDGVKASINGNTLFSRWTGSSGTENKGIITGLTANYNVLKIDYLEKSNRAFVAADVLPFGQWLGYYYTNSSLSGVPTQKKVIKGDQNGAFSFDIGYNSPISGISKDNYSAKFTTAMRLTAGEYVIKSIADDGVRIYIDDKLVVDRWKSGNSVEDAIKVNIADNNNLDSTKKNVHWIRVEYLEKAGKSKLNFDIKPVNEFVTTSDWLHVLYPNKNLSGTGKVITNSKISTIQYNWEKETAFAGIPKDNFSASFLKKITGDSNYFVSTYADDGIRVKLDNKVIIDRWKNSAGEYNKAVIKNVSTGSHLVQTDYYDSTGNANVYADVQPIGNWIAYYYNNKTLSGTPVTSKVIDNSNSMTLTQDLGKSAPASKVNSDNFSAKYVTAKKIDAGQYVIRGLSDDGVRVYIDGKLVIDNWRTGSYSEKATKLNIEDTADGNIHWIEVRFYDDKGTGKFQFKLEKYSDSNIVDGSGWYTEYYPKVIGKEENPQYRVSDTVKPVIIGGKNSINNISTINFNWGSGTPNASIATNNFSAIFKRTITIAENTNYNFIVKADDGVILEIDGEVVIDAWQGNVNKVNEASGYYLTKGKHDFVIKYREASGNASVSFEMKKSKTVFKLYHTLSYSLDKAVSIQSSKNAQTDKKYRAYIREDAFSYVSSYYDYGLINSGTWNVRGAANTSSWIIGQFKSGNKVTILSKTSKKDSNGKYWYEVDYYKYWVETRKATSELPAKYSTSYHTWVNASPSDIKYYLNPNNFVNDDKQKLQFLSLSSSANLSDTEVNNKILSGKGILAGKAESFIEAGEKYGINEIYLISHALLETGNGTSTLAKGVKVTSVDGQAVTPKIVYNMYGIGAYDSSPLKSGSEYAYKQGWTTPEKAIIGGAEFIGKNYINHATYKQNTLYEMRWNPNNPGVHQYATDIGWASKQVSQMYALYNLLTSYRMELDIPRYQE